MVIMASLALKGNGEVLRKALQSGGEMLKSFQRIFYGDSSAEDGVWKGHNHSKFLVRV